MYGTGMSDLPPSSPLSRVFFLPLGYTAETQSSSVKHERRHLRNSASRSKQVDFS